MGAMLKRQDAKDANFKLLFLGALGVLAVKGIYLSQVCV